MVRGQGILVQEIKEETRFLGRKKWRPLFGGHFPVGIGYPCFLEDHVGVLNYLRNIKWPILGVQERL